MLNTSSRKKCFSVKWNTFRTTLTWCSPREESDPHTTTSLSKESPGGQMMISLDKFGINSSHQGFWWRRRASPKDRRPVQEVVQERGSHRPLFQACPHTQTGVDTFLKKLLIIKMHKWKLNLSKAKLNFGTDKATGRPTQYPLISVENVFVFPGNYYKHNVFCGECFLENVFFGNVFGKNILENVLVENISAFPGNHYTHAMSSVENDFWEYKANVQIALSLLFW